MVAPVGCMDVVLPVACIDMCVVPVWCMPVCMWKLCEGIWDWVHRRGVVVWHGWPSWVHGCGVASGLHRTLKKIIYFWVKIDLHI